MKKTILLFAWVMYAVSCNAQTFVEQTSIYIPPIIYGSALWVDYDGDGDLDISLSGDTVLFEPLAAIFSNNGNNTFTRQPGFNFGFERYSAHSWGDLDNDGDLDLMMNGGGTFSYYTYLFLNDSLNSFHYLWNNNLKGVFRSYSAWGDYDNDGDLDVFVMGKPMGVFNGESYLYKNNGDSTFTKQTALNFGGVYAGEAKWGDYDNDGDLDLVMTGCMGNSATEPLAPYSMVYENDGNGGFSEAFYPVWVQNSSVAWGDYDNDGDLDLLIAGEINDISNGSSVTKLYRNNGGNSFTEVTGLPFAQVYTCSVAWGDYNLDGFIDVLLTGFDGYSNPYIVSKIYKNNGNGTFTVQASAGLTGVRFGSASWGDYDNDGDLDILLTGQVDQMGPTVAKIYKNTTIIKGQTALLNNAPSVPANLSASIIPGNLIMKWGKSSDDHTPSKAIAYNLRVGRTHNGIEITSPESILATGKRKLVDMGNAQLDTTYILKLDNFNIGDSIYWSVQAIDNAFQASAFSNETYAVVCQSYLFSNHDTICGGDSILWRGNYYKTTGHYTNSFPLGAICDSTYELYLTVIAPVISPFPADTLYQLDGAVSLPQASPPGGVFSGNGIIFNTFDPSAVNPGENCIFYTITTPNCNLTDTLCFWVLPGSAINEVDNTSRISLLPNPATDELIISSVNPNKIIERVIIYNMQFQEVIVSQIKSGSGKLDISKLSKGSYCVKIIGQDFTAIKKLVVK